MPVIEVKIVAFLECDAQISMPQSTQLRLEKEDMQSPSDLLKFDEDDIARIA